MFGTRFSSSVGPIGIDIGARGIRLLQVREQAGDIDAVGAATLNYSTPTDDPAWRRELADALQHAVMHGGFNGRKCVLSLARCDLSVQPVRLPRMPEADLRQALRWEAAERFGLPRDRCEVDYVRTGAAPTGGEARDEFLVVASSHDSLNRWLEPILEAGLRPVAVDAWFAAVARAYSRMYRRESDEETVRALIEVGASGSTIMILRGDQVAFCKPLTFSGQDMDRAVAAQLRIEPTIAADLRAQRIRAAAGQNTDYDATTDRAIFDAVRPLLGDLVREGTMCLRYYGVTFRGRPPELFVLSGGEAFEPHLDEMIAQSCKATVQRDDSVGTLSRLHAQVARRLGPDAGLAGSWAVSAGLSMRGLAIARQDRRRTSNHPAVRKGAA